MQQFAPVLFSDCRWYISAGKMRKNSRHQRRCVVLTGLTSIATSITWLQQLKESRIVNESVYSTMIMKAFRKFLKRHGKIGARLWCSLALLGRDKHLKYKRTRKP